MAKLKTPKSTRAAPRFMLGRHLMTPGVEAAVDNHTMYRAMGRHVRGDWGDVCKEDAATNDAVIKSGADARLFSVYHTLATLDTPEGPGRPAVKFWIITEANRASTTILLPEEY